MKQLSYSLNEENNLVELSIDNTTGLAKLRTKKVNSDSKK